MLGLGARCLLAGLIVLAASCSHTTASLTYPHEYAGFLDGGDRLPCTKFFVLRAEATECITLDSSIPTITADLCSTPAGPLLAIYSPESDRNVFTARVTGPQVVMLPLTACSVAPRLERGTHDTSCDNSTPAHTTALYAVLSGYIPGSYSLDVALLYQGFSYGKDRMIISNTTLHLMSAEITVSPPGGHSRRSAARLLGSAYHPCNYCEGSAQAWPVCNSTNLQGSWVANLGNGATAVPDRYKTTYDTEVLRWQPHGCNFMPLSSINLTQCLSAREKHICFVGDSQTRHLYNGFVDAINRPGYQPVWSSNQTTDKSTKSNDFCSYMLMTFGDNWIHEQLDKCTHVLFNLGQWPLSHKPPVRWSASRFVQVLLNISTQIQRYSSGRPGAARFYWTSINSHAYGPMHNECNEFLDSRTHPFNDLFNAVAEQVMAMNGVPVINTGLLTGHLFDLSYDGAHYHWHGAVGHYLTEYLANVLCVQDS